MGQQWECRSYNCVPELIKWHLLTTLRLGTGYLITTPLKPQKVRKHTESFPEGSDDDDLYSKVLSSWFRHQVPIQFGWSLSLALMSNKSIKSTTIFCHVPPYSPVAVNRRFHRTSWLRLYVWSRSCLLFADYLLSLDFSPEDGGTGSCEASVNLYRTT